MEDLYQFYKDFLSDYYMTLTDQHLNAHIDGLAYELEDTLLDRFLPLTYENFIKLKSYESSRNILGHVEEIILKEKNDEAKKSQLKQFVADIKYYLYKIEPNSTGQHIANDLKMLLTDINIRFSNISGEEITPIPQTNNAKIKWLDSVNVLATLFYDLWKGQTVPRQSGSTRQLIEVQKKDLIQFLMSNFVDADNNPLSRSTLDTYLNSSREESRAQIGTRIELTTP